MTSWKKNNKWGDADYDDDDMYDDEDYEYTPEPSMGSAQPSWAPQQQQDQSLAVTIQHNDPSSKVPLTAEEKHRLHEEQAARLASREGFAETVKKAREELREKGYHPDPMSDEAVFALIEQMRTADRELAAISATLGDGARISAVDRTINLQGHGELFFAIRAPESYPTAAPEVEMPNGLVADFTREAIRLTAPKMTNMLTRVAKFASQVLQDELLLPRDHGELEQALADRWAALAEGEKVTLPKGQGTLRIEVKRTKMELNTGNDNDDVKNEEGCKKAAVPSSMRRWGAAAKKPKPKSKPVARIASSPVAVRSSSTTIWDNDAALLDKLATALDNNYDSVTFTHRLLTKPVPASISQLHHLVSLNLTGTGINNLPSFSHNTRLHKVYLPSNQFKRIPASLLTTNMRDLEVLDMSNNQLSALPTELGQMSKLRILCVEYNRIKTLCSFDKMEKLEVLELVDNDLTGIPSEIGMLKKLWRLKMSANPMYEIPAEVYHQGIEAVKKFLLEMSPASLPVPPSSFAKDMQKLNGTLTEANAPFVLTFKYKEVAEDNDEPEKTVENTVALLHRFFVEARAPNLLKLAESYQTQPIEDEDPTSHRRTQVRARITDDFGLPTMKAFVELLLTGTVNETAAKDEKLMPQLLRAVAKYGGAHMQRDALKLSNDAIVDQDAALASSFASYEKHFRLSYMRDAADSGNDAPSEAAAESCAFDEEDLVSFSVGDEGVLLKAHRSLIISRCEYFKAMLESGLAESQMDVIPVPDVDPRVFETLLTYLYSDHHGKKMTPDNVVDLLFLAAKYEVVRLRAMAECMVGFNVEVDNVAQVVQLAYFLDCERLKTACMYFISGHLDAVKRTEGWAQLQDEVKDQLMDLMKQWKK